MIKIISNGSKFHGEPPDSIQDLIDLLGKKPLSPSMAETHGVEHSIGKGKILLQGNFAEVSHVFRIEGTLEELEPLRSAIYDNLVSKEYKEARREWGFDKQTTPVAA